MPYKVKQEGAKWRIEVRHVTGWKTLPAHYKTKKSATQVIRHLYAQEHGHFPSGKRKK